MNITLIPHAQERLGKYNVSRSLVVETINNPDEVVKGRMKGRQRWIAHKLLDDEILRVIYEIEDEAIRVVTLYLGKKERYYKGGIRENKV